MSSRPSTSYSWRSSIFSASPAVAEAGAHRRLDLEPHDLAEPATAKLLLDRLEHVVGLVGDVVVGVAGDPEEGVVDDLHPREQRREVRRDQVLQRDERRARRPPIATNRPSSSFGTLTRATTSVP